MWAADQGAKGATEMTEPARPFDLTKQTFRQVEVALDARSYPIMIGPGLLNAAGEIITRRLPGAKCAIVTDENVADLHLSALERALAARGLPAGAAIILPPGEATKSFSQLATLCERLLELGVERKDAVIAFGGGVIGDLAGFAASILRRGVALIQIPTTLLAQVDSSVGGKTGINTPQGKNLIGTFHQPRLVIADTDVLQTLPPRELRAGYAEIVKYGLIENAAFFEWLERHWHDVLNNEAAARAYAIEKSCQIKAAIVAQDEREAGRRGLLNLGHTFGHALEAWAGYSDRLLHGEAVAIGMVLAFKLSEKKGLCTPGLHARVAAHLRAAGLLCEIADLAVSGSSLPEPGALIGHMMQDKKVKGGRLTFVLTRGIGKAFLTQDVTMEELGELLAKECNIR